MKHRILLATFIPALLVLSAWTATVMAAPSGGTGEKATLTIQGMTCGGCVATVKLKLRKTKGVLDYEVSLDKGEAVVTYDPGATNAEAIAASVSETGFKATVKAKDKT
jgi:copper chaperone CopZ